MTKRWTLWLPRREPASNAATDRGRVGILSVSIIALSLLLTLSGPRDVALAATFEAGGLMFSDERGGFRLISVIGQGTPADPIVLVEEFSSLGPAILTIRPVGTPSSFSPTPARAVLQRSLVKVVINLSAFRWSGFDLELRDGSGRASVYSDGLSFDQPRVVRHPLSSDRFADNRIQDEPFDRLRFDHGQVASDEAVRLSFNVVDLNPRPVFYLVQEPIILLTQRRLAPLATRITDASSASDLEQITP